MFHSVCDPEFGDLVLVWHGAAAGCLTDQKTWRGAAPGKATPGCLTDQKSRTQRPSSPFSLNTNKPERFSSEENSSMLRYSPAYFAFRRS